MAAVKIVQVARYIRTLRGGSQPILAQATDGFHYVVKFINNLQGPNLLFNESAGSELLRACGLSVPAWKPLLLSDRFIDANPDCWLQTAQGVLRPQPGLCFGSRFLESPGRRLLEILPSSSFTRITNRKSFWLARLIDVCSSHADSRQAIFEESPEGWLHGYFIDNGYLFGGANGTTRPRFEASGYLDPRVYTDVSSDEIEDLLQFPKALDKDDLWRRVKVLPGDWKTESALRGFEKSLGHLSDYNMLRNVMDTLIDVQRRRVALDRSRKCAELDISSALLHTRIPPKSTWELGFDREWQNCRALA